MRIVSLLPSTTEILFAVGAGPDVVGVTFECNFPSEARLRRIVSTSSLPAGLTPAEIDADVRRRLAAGDDLYRLDRGALRELDAELVLTQDLCAVCAVDVGTVGAALEHLGCHAEVVTVDPGTLDEVLASVVTVGRASGHGTQAEDLVDRLTARLGAVAGAVAGRPTPRVVVLEWPEPPFSAGHWVPDMVTAAGGRPVLGASGARSETVTWDEVAGARPDVVVMAPCGFDLAAATEMAAGLCARRSLPDGVPVWAVDADAAFVRPGPRVVDGVEALAAVLHPGTCPERPDIAARVRA